MRHPALVREQQFFRHCIVSSVCIISISFTTICLLYFSGFVVSQDLVKLLLNGFFLSFICSHFVYQ